MDTRRNFLRILTSFLASGGLLKELFPADLVSASQEQVVVPKGTAGTELKNRNPKGLDTRQLDVTPLNQFGTMGLDSHKVDLQDWRLNIKGEVDQELSLSYNELLELPQFERAVLMICPGFFANHGLWTGVSISSLLKLAKSRPGVNYVTFRGPSGNYAKVMRIPMDEIRRDQAFLAFKVNNETLPQKHGFPLRLVAEGYYGYDWVKYVDSITVESVS